MRTDNINFTLFHFFSSVKQRYTQHNYLTTQPFYSRFAQFPGRGHQSLLYAYIHIAKHEPMQHYSNQSFDHFIITAIEVV